MSDAVERAAEVIDAAIGSEPHERRLYPDLYAGKVAQALADAGLLATKEAEVWERGYLMGYRDSDLGRYAHYTRNPYIAGGETM